MISVIIPCFNAELFIKETLDSILNQDEELTDVILVDDGSTDQSASVVKAYNDPRIVYMHQANKGVSVARNKGLAQAKGEFLVFFDADDKMSSGFLKERKKVLADNPDIGFCCGPVNAFPVEQQISFGIAENVAEVLLTYQPQYSSCPSNYLIRKSVLIDHQLFFNESLSSTADRYFLLQLSATSKGKLIQKAPLLYRVTANSMSGKLSKILVRDNEKYFLELRKHNLIPVSLEKTFHFRIQYILGFGFIRTGSYLKGMKYTISAFLNDPKNFLNKIF